nr:MAG TPA: Pre-mRNA-splicing factor 8, Pre-mRNA-splicing factor-mRNA splicing, spliceosome, post-catalytic, P [Caudoviricetes sp.]
MCFAQVVIPRQIFHSPHLIHFFLSFRPSGLLLF